MSGSQPTPRPLEEQGAVLAFLGRTEPGVQRIDTHASIVFLGKDRVLKVKRALRLPYLDYSSLERRQAACEAELEVNKRFAPDLYRRVVPITEDLHGLSVGGAGRPVEWAVEMVRFDEKAGLDRIASQGIPQQMAELMSDAVRSSHDGSSSAEGGSWLSSIGRLIDQNTARFGDIASLPPLAVQRLHQESHAARTVQLSKLRLRAESGFVRRCHGDLHLGNIVLIKGRPVLFDAIEFDPVMATTDVLYDLCFVLMDLIHYRQSAAANVMMNRYLTKTDPANYDALSLLPLFMSLRAAIRANVLFTKWEQTGRNALVAKEARRYFDLATRLIVPRRAVALAVGGLSGSGKSVLSRAVAPLLGATPGAVVLRSDVVRKSIFQVDELTPLAPSAYEPDVTGRVYARLLSVACSVLSQGHSVVIDAAFLRQDERDAFDAMDPPSSVRFGLFLDAKLSVRLSRIAGRRRDASDATAAVAVSQDSADLGEVAWPVISTDKTFDETFANVIQLIGPILETAEEGG